MKLTKKHRLNLVLNEIKQSEDPTIIPCTFIVLDYDVSGNNVIVDKDVALEGGKTLINKPIVAKYNEVEEPNTKTDNFGGHEQYLGEDRYGNLTVKSDTVPIGVFTTEGYELTININGEEKEVMAADAVLWKTRFSDACDLLLEWFNSGITINTSCEYLYSNFTLKDGIEYHHSPIYFEGHAVLASENRGDQSLVLPAYESSKLLSFNEINKFNKLVAQAINQEDKEEKENMKFFKKINELSHSDIRSLLYGQLDPSLNQNEYSWISDVYESYFVANVYSYAEGNEFDKYFKFNYSKDGEAISVDLESKTEVMVKRDWVEVSQFQSVQNELEEKSTKVEELTTQLNEKEGKLTELETQLNTVTTEKESVEKQFNEVSEKVVTLSTQVEELKPFRNQVEQEKLEKALNEKKDFYSKKFNALKAAEKFDSEEVQELITKSIDETEEGKQAILQLNTMLVELVEVTQEPKTEDPVIRELSSKRENLIPASNDFESRYSN
ncbi:hypothetical protein AF332_11270 [Sporosarcina globispora]|uniref:Uncharacterized protein n=1 Tax=Sporosarcina globispora TaxID=1459 RepID=A0A0M0GBY0_SPOGL|nr:hypothetical protein [Sporosarcina globispora]KON87349.1 hypothetical protein AF332_11270 [Sporosarcina globispora]